MNIRSALSWLIVAVGLATLPPIAQAQSKSIVIAFEGDFPPYNYTEGGTLKGFEVDLAKDLCERAKLNCTMVVQEWSGLIPGLVAGKSDAVMAAMSITDERRKVIGFSVPYMRARNGFFASNKSSLAKLPGTGTSFDLTNDEAAAKEAIDKMRPLLKGKVIGVQGSSTNATFIDKYLKGVFEVREYKTSKQSELDLLSGRIDAVVQSNTSLSETKKDARFDNYEIWGPTFYGGPFGTGVGVGLRKGDVELKKTFDKAIREAFEDGTIPRLVKQWFKTESAPINTQ